MWDAPQTIRATGFAHVVGDLWSPRGVWRTQSRCVLWFSSALKVMLFFFCQARYAETVLNKDQGPRGRHEVSLVRVSAAGDVKVRRELT